MGRPREFRDEALVAATQRALCRVGYAALTLADVAREAGVAPATLVKRFGSKRGLLLAFLDAAAAATPATFAAERAARASPLDALLARYLRRLEVAGDPVSLANLLSFYTATAADPEFAERVARRMRVQAEEIQQALDAAVARGELVACDTRRVAHTLLAAVNGAPLLWHLDPTQAPDVGTRLVFATILDPLQPKAPPAIPIDPATIRATGGRSRDAVPTAGTEV